MRSALLQLETHFYYPWNSARRRAHIVISILALLLALAVCAAAPLQELRAAPAAVPANPAVNATLAALQDNPAVLALVPNGNDLYVGGTFNSIGGLNARGIARYNLQTGQWSVLGADTATNGNGVNGLIAAIVVVGNDLYVGGSFTKGFNNLTTAISANCIARFNMTAKTWHALGAGTGAGGNGFNGDVGSLVVHNGLIYAGGTFKDAHNNTGNDVLVNGVARWNPATSNWSALGKGTGTASSGGVVSDLALINNDLYVGGSFASVTNTDGTKLGVDCIARWSTVTNTWSVLGAAAGNGNNGVAGDVYALATNGADLFVGGSFIKANNSGSAKVAAQHLARWNGITWSVVGSAENSNGVNGNVTELNFTGGVLNVGGGFTSAFNNGATLSANCIVRWTGSAWAAFGAGTGVNANGVDQDVQVITAIGGNLYVGGEFTKAFNSAANSINAPGIARWNGTAWAALSGGTAIKSLATVSAASFSAGDLAAEGIVAAYGTGLATSTVTATTTPLPTSLGGTSVAVRDSAGVTRAAPLFFVSSGQVNFMIPAGTANGVANITLTSGDNSLSGGDVTIANVAPGLFTLNANGQGVVAAVALRVKNNVQTYETIANFDTATQRWVTKPIDLGAANEIVYLIPYGSGIRKRSAVTNVVSTIGGTVVSTEFAGPQGGLVGVDQLNLKLERSLIGRGELDLIVRVDGKPANTVRVNIK